MEEYTGGRLVSSQLAKKLKEVGYTTYNFIGLYKGAIYYGPESAEGIELDNFNLGKYEYLAPLQYDVQRWLRSVHGMDTHLLWKWADHGITDKIIVRSIITNKGRTLVNEERLLPNVTHIGSELEKLLFQSLSYVKK